MSLETRVGTANIKVTLSNDDAEVALWKVIREEHPDLLVLTEWGRGRNHILNEVSRRSHLRWDRPDLGGGPVLYDGSRYSPLRTNARILARQAWVGRLTGRKATLPDSVATEVILYDDLLCREVAVIGFHLTAEVQYGAGYRTDRAHRARVKRHRHERKRLARIVRRHRKADRLAYAAGDGNFDGMTLPPLTSCWTGRKGGTLGNRAVDIVFAEQPAIRVDLTRTGSDHDAVVATYKES